MGDVNFYLKKAEEGADTQLIYLQFRYSGQKFVYAFGEKIAINNWNPDKQRVKNKNATTRDGKHLLNDTLDELARQCKLAYREESKDGSIPAPKTLKQRMDDFRNQHLNEDPNKDKTLFKLIDRFIAGDIKHKGRDKSIGSLNNYRSVKIHLEDYQKKNNYKIDFETITLDFFYGYTAFLKKVTKLKPNTIQKDVTLLKTFMAEAVDLGYTTNLQFRHKKFSVEKVETDATYLNDKEIMKLYNHDFSKHKKLETVRDLFLVGAFTGLRHSDFSSISLENVIELDGETFIKMITQKTKELVIIPTNPIIKEILAKYNGLPRAISNQKFNDYIKDVCKEAGLTVTGRLSSDPKKELWQTVASHTARRSFATNTYKEGFPTYELMKITGHRSEKSFYKYLKVSKEDSARRLNEHVKLNWSKKILQVAS